MEVACVCSWHWNYFWNHLSINKSPLSVKTSYITARISHAKCWPFKYWWSLIPVMYVRKFGSAFGGEVTRRCACVCTYTTCQKRTHSTPAVGFGIRFGLVIHENVRIDPKIMGGSLNGLLALKLFLEPFYTWMKVRSLSHTFQSALRMLIVDHLNIDGPPFLVKCVSKFRSKKFWKSNQSFPINHQI